MEGTAPEFKLIKRNPNENNDDDDDDLCMARSQCDFDSNDPNVNIPVVLAPCTHCGAKDWNIVGDANSGYVVTNTKDGKQLCLGRESKTCDFMLFLNYCMEFECLIVVLRYVTCITRRKQCDCL